MKTFAFILTIACSILLCAAARAGLKWEQTAIELHPAVTDREAIGLFKYQNGGDKPVHFKGVRTSCGCTAAQSQKDKVAPGEKGEIKATFSIGERTGTQVKTVTVETDDPVTPITVLTLKAVIPQALEIAPALVYWTNGEDPKAKTIIVKPAADFRVKDLKVTSSSPDFQTKIEKNGNGEFKIDVQPSDTKRLLAAMLTIQPEGSPKVFYANARVLGPQPNPVVSPVTR